LLVRAAATKAAHAAAPELIAHTAKASNVLRCVSSRKLLIILKVAKYQVNAFEIRKTAAKRVFALNLGFFARDFKDICESNNSLMGALNIIFYNFLCFHGTFLLPDFSAIFSEIFT